MNLGEQAFVELFPEKEEKRAITVTYTRAMKGYNGNVRYNHDTIRFRLSHTWKDVSFDIKKGLLQTLLCKMFRVKKTTISMDLYTSFIKHLSTYGRVTANDPLLQDSFQRMNQQYFHGMLDQPNLIWGLGTSKLGHFAYSTNTILISKILMEEPLLLDYVMYHEMLHKKLKFHVSGNQTRHHTKEFKQLEAQFHDKRIEQKLNAFVRRKKGYWF